MLIGNQTLTVIRRQPGEYVDSVWVEGSEKKVSWPKCTVQALNEEELLRIPDEAGLRTRARYSVTSPRDVPLQTASGTSRSPDLVLFQGQRWEVHVFGDFPNLIQHHHYVLAQPEIVQEDGS